MGLLTGTWSIHGQLHRQKVSLPETSQCIHPQESKGVPAASYDASVQENVSRPNLVK